MSESTTRPAALRLTDKDRERVLAYGGTVRAAVLRLLDIAEEHEQCPVQQRPAAPPVARFTPPTPTVSYKVAVPGEGDFVTTDHAEALGVAQRYGVRVRRA